MRFVFLCALLSVSIAFAQDTATDDIFAEEIVDEVPTPDTSADASIEKELAEPAPSIEAEEDILEDEMPVASPAEESLPANTPAAISQESDELTYPDDVEVEKTVYMKELQKKDCNCGYSYLMPYGQRRNTLGFAFTLGYSQYTPTYYKPDFVVNQTYESYYGYTETPLIDLTLGIKWNMGIGSFTFEFGGGYYFNNSKNEDDNSNLKIIPVRVGVTYAMDMLFEEPYVVPYGTVGTYTSFYNENLASQSVSGNTPFGIYYGAGALLQLNALDESAATASYDTTGLENTYVFLEMRSFMTSTDVPNLGTDPQFGAGLKLEY